MQLSLAAEKAVGLNCCPRAKEHSKAPDVIKHWGFAYVMVERLLKQIEAIWIVLDADRSSSHLIPSVQSCDILQAVVVALKPLKEMTDALSAEKLPQRCW